MAVSTRQATKGEMQAAIRSKLDSASPRKTTLDNAAPRTRVFDPTEIGRSVQNILNEDPIYSAIYNKWLDTQAHGRLTYDAMMKHPAVSSPLGHLVTFLKTYKPLFKSPAANPTDKQKEIADFSNEQLRRLSMSGNPTQGYDKLIEWFGLGLRYGFTLAEMETVTATWRKKKMVQIKRIIPIPQASLDMGFQPREEFSQISLGIDPRYRCFKIAPDAQVQSIHQFYYSGNKEMQVTWEGDDLDRILHFVHGGGDGNVFGTPMLYSAFYAWASLYTLEQLEEVFLEASLPYMTASYKSPNGVPSPEYHAQFMAFLQQQDPAIRALIGPDTVFGSVSASNPDFVAHAAAKKKELRQYITQALFMPTSVYSESGDTESDSRNLIQVFFKYIAPAILKEIGAVLQGQFARRLIEANYSHLDEEDYPVLDFQIILPDDLRVSQEILKMAIPMMDAERLGEALHALVPQFEKEWIATDLAKSVKKVFEVVEEGAPGGGSPPPKKPGSPDVRKDGQTESIGQKTKVSA